ncbi:efflux RND transporter periplasmic adaptor subunit [Desulfitobacterium hafniense]|nr:efflux RND transporter periplasmic adaptor subunit [Desulfitobacterium hafniense]EHL04324.1 efflux transporter, RND family, MFP subunit [Desulfitobacterium hafniense DP7]KTE92367.1 RND transporter [Desulfitobacterium hafniense]MEA5025980.1 efflux RND transporter periplasmic adaptor subunit [Desulfitobacterium hafniense]CDX01336.1 Efflux transporter, RND, MFP subunit [Desulfitobacterium hafniense]
MNIPTDLQKVKNDKRNMRLTKKLLWVIGILLVLAAGLGWTLSNRGTPAETAPAKLGDIQKYVEETGEVKCSDSATVYLEGSGLIKRIAVETGQQVQKGDLLLSMDREQLEISLKNAAELLNQAKAQSAAGEEAYTMALKDYDNTRSLAEAGAASEWELTQKEAALKSAEAVRSGNQAALEQAELSVANSSLALSKQQVLAPLKGTILQKRVEVNAFGVPGTVAFVIGDTENLEIQAKILAEDAASIQVGNKATLTVRTKEQQTLAGTVVKIAPTAEDEVSSLGVKQKKVTVTIKPLDAQVALLPGSEVDVRVITETKSGVVIVPAGAVFDYRGQSCVFTVEEGKAALRAVQRGIQNESLCEITEGLQEGETVLSAPDNSIEEGTRILSPLQ